MRCCAAEYGDKDNSDLAERFGIKADTFPQYRLWKKGSTGDDSPTKFTGEKKAAEFLRFVQETAGAWIGLPGQIKSLDELAKQLVRGEGDKAALLAKAEAASKESGEEMGKYYVKVRPCSWGA